MFRRIPYLDFKQQFPEPMTSAALEHVETVVKRSQHEFDYVKNALLNPNPTFCSKPLPENVVLNILELAQFWPAAEKSCSFPFEGYQLNVRFFKFGPLPGKARRLEFEFESHDQGWSSYPEHSGTYENSWTWGEIDIKNSAGESKLNGRKRIFTNRHADSTWQTHSNVLTPENSFLECMEKGDTLEFHFRSEFPGWCIYVRKARMVVHYDGEI